MGKDDLLVATAKIEKVAAIATARSDDLGARRGGVAQGPRRFRLCRPASGTRRGLGIAMAARPHRVLAPRCRPGDGIASLPPNADDLAIFGEPRCRVSAAWLAGEGRKS